VASASRWGPGPAEGPGIAPRPREFVRASPGQPATALTERVLFGDDESETPPDESAVFLWLTDMPPPLEHPVDLGVVLPAFRNI